MGNLFQLIADDALEPLVDYVTCDVCGRSDQPLFPYNGFVGAAREDVFSVCAKCIKTSPVEHVAAAEYKRRIRAYVEAQALPADEQVALIGRLAEAYRRTPDLPLFLQYEDRPLCCRDLTEFTGYPASAEELFAISTQYTYWQKGAQPATARYDFRQTGLPESLHDVAAFRCLHCGERYYTFQFT